jgi:hypothetical protein
MDSNCHLPRCTSIMQHASRWERCLSLVSARSIPIRVCHLKECCDEGIVELRHIGTKYQLADIGTKALPAPVFISVRDVILGKVSFSDLQGM